jgi:hypothetical protein
MRGTFDFKCANGHVYEDFIDVDVQIIQCPYCSEMSEKQLSAPRLLRKDGFPIDIDGDRWAKTREKNSKRFRENNEM